MASYAAPGGGRFGGYPFHQTTFDLWRIWPERVEKRVAPKNYAAQASRTEALSQSIALGNSREPPAFTFSGRNR